MRLKCEQAREMLTAWIDGQVSAEERLALESHRASCTECRSALEDLRSVVSQLRDWEQAVSPPFTEAPVAAERVLLACAAAASPLRMSRWWAAAGVAAALLGFAVGLAIEAGASPSPGDSASEIAAEVHPLPVDPAVVSMQWPPR